MMFRNGLLSLSFVCTLSLHGVSAAQDLLGAGMIKTLEGSVQVQRANAKIPAVAGQRVMQGDQLVTAPNGSTTVMLRDGTVVMLGPQSTLDLSRFQYDSTTQEGSLGLRLLQGSVRMLTGLIAKINPSAVKLETPSAVIGVRGTDFIVSFAPGE